MDESEIKELTWLGARMREPSTYLGLGGVLLALHLSGAEAATVTNLITAAGIFVGSVIGILLPDGGLRPSMPGPVS